MYVRNDCKRHQKIFAKRFIHLALLGRSLLWRANQEDIEPMDTSDADEDLDFDDFDGEDDFEVHG